jgi:acyl dehydratase
MKMSGREIKLGDSESVSTTITEEHIAAFANASGDRNPVHFDEQYAAATRFRKRIAHGMLSGSLISAVLGMKLPGPGTIYLAQSLEFKRPVFLGDIVTTTVTVKGIDVASGVITLETVCLNQQGKPVVTGEARVLYEPLMQAKTAA